MTLTQEKIDSYFIYKEMNNAVDCPLSLLIYR